MQHAEDHGPNTWKPNVRQPAEEHRAQRRLADAVRRVNALLLDTGVSVAELDEATALVEQVAAKLGEHHAPERYGYGEAGVAGRFLARLDRSPVAGRHNPLAPPLRMHVADSEVTATARFGIQYEGPPGHVHGGLIAAAFDEVLGAAQATRNRAGMTAYLHVDYRSPTPLREEVRFRAWVESIEGRKTFTRGTLHFGDRLCAEGTGLFIQYQLKQFAALDGAP